MRMNYSHFLQKLRCWSWRHYLQKLPQPLQRRQWHQLCLGGMVVRAMCTYFRPEWILNFQICLLAYSHRHPLLSNSTTIVIATTTSTAITFSNSTTAIAARCRTIQNMPKVCISIVSGVYTLENWHGTYKGNHLPNLHFWVPFSRVPSFGREDELTLPRPSDPRAEKAATDFSAKKSLLAIHDFKRTNAFLPTSSHWNRYFWILQGQGSERFRFHSMKWWCFFVFLGKLDFKW